MKWKWTTSVLTIPMVVAAVGIAAVDVVPEGKNNEAGKANTLEQIAPTQQQVGDDSDRGALLRTNAAAEPGVDDGGLIWDSRSFGLPMPVGGSPVECPEADACPDCEGDLNESGTVDGADLLILLSCWGPVDPACECSDFNSAREAMYLRKPKHAVTATMTAAMWTIRRSGRRSRAAMLHVALRGRASKRVIRRQDNSPEPVKGSAAGNPMTDAGATTNASASATAARTSANGAGLRMFLSAPTKYLFATQTGIRSV